MGNVFSPGGHQQRASGEPESPGRCTPIISRLDSAEKPLKVAKITRVFGPENEGKTV
jgi:hypothetical protein